MTTMSRAAQIEMTKAQQRDGVGRLLKGWLNDLVAHWMRREAVKSLRELDDRALRDIGLVRDQIENAVSGTASPSLDRFRH